MIFKVTPKDGSPSFSLDEHKLYEQLMIAVVDSKRQNETFGGEQIIEVLGNWLSVTSYLIKYNFLSALFIAFKLGFYFCRFTSKQSVEIIEDKELSSQQKE